VRELIEGKNLFIGICSRNERVTRPEKLKKRILGGGFYVNEQDFSWKTSDWIIQEIGLAIGRGMNLILLVEEGVRPPGGLQGNLEYISFNRDFPERTFSRIIEMINTLVPKSTASSDSTGSKTSSSAQQEVNNKEVNEELPLPDKSWTKSDFEKAFIRGILFDEIEYCEKISQSFIDRSESNNQSVHSQWLAFVEKHKILFTGKGSISQLERIASENPDDFRIQLSLCPDLCSL